MVGPVMRRRLSRAEQQRDVGFIGWRVVVIDDGQVAVDDAQWGKLLLEIVVAVHRHGGVGRDVFVERILNLGDCVEVFLMQGTQRREADYKCAERSELDCREPRVSRRR